jgi:putative toxin-antitoxin system antitoxin component (TIGR02293 family)
MPELMDAARVLGVETDAKPLKSGVAYLNLIGHGLPVKSLDRIAQAVAPDDANFKYRLVPKASLARSKTSRRLTAAQSVAVTRLAAIWSQALRIWKSETAARDFLNRQHALLAERRPIDLVLENEIGAGLVRDVLGRLEYGSAV